MCFCGSDYSYKPLLTSLPTGKEGTELHEKHCKGVSLKKVAQGNVPPSHLCALIKMSEEHTRRDDFSPLPQASALSLWIRELSWRLKERRKYIKIFLALSSLCGLSRPERKSKLLLSRVGNFQEIKQCTKEQWGQGGSGFSRPLKSQQVS